MEQEWAACRLNYPQVDFCFKRGNKQFIVVGKYGTRWANNKKLSIYNFFMIFTKKAVKHLLKNCFFQLITKTFRQNIGIAMESNSI